MEDVAVATEAEEVLQRMQQLVYLHRVTYEHVRETADEQAERRRQVMDKRAGRLVQGELIPVGTEVYVREPRRDHTTASKMAFPYRGPYRVKRVNAARNYVLEDGAGKELERSVPRNFIKVAREGVTEAGGAPVTVLQTRETALGTEVRVRWLDEKSDERDQVCWVRAEDFVTDEPSRT